MGGVVDRVRPDRIHAPPDLDLEHHIPVGQCPAQCMGGSADARTQI